MKRNCLFLTSLILLVAMCLSFVAAGVVHAETKGQPISDRYSDVKIPRYDPADYEDLLDLFGGDSLDLDPDEPINFYENRKKIHPDFFRIGIRYFADLCFFSENKPDQPRIMKRWPSRPIYIYYDKSTCKKSDRRNIKELFQELSRIPNVPHYQRVDNPNMAHIVLYLGAEDELRQQFPDFNENSNGQYDFYFDDNYVITNARVLVATDEAKKMRRHIVFEELYQVLGITDDSYEFRDSISQQASSLVQNLAPIDYLVLELLYSPVILPGMGPEQAMQLLADRYLDYVEDDPDYKVPKPKKKKAGQETLYRNRDHVDDAEILDAIERWSQIAFNEEGAVMRRWENSLRIELIGDFLPADRGAVESVVEDLNRIGFLPEISVTEDHNFRSNFFIHLLTDDKLAKLYPWLNPNTFNYEFGQDNVPYLDEIRYALITVRSDETQEAKTHSIFATMAACLGLNGTYDNPESIFHSESWTSITDLSEDDLRVIELHYAPCIHSGMLKEEAIAALKDYYGVD